MDELTVDGFVPCSLRVDLSGSMQDIEARLIGNNEHHAVVRRKVGTDLSSFDIERSILRFWDRGDMCKRGKYGLFWHEHLLRFMKLLMPGTAINPAFVDQSIALELALHHRYDVTNLIGAKSCLDPETVVRMFDGSTKKACEVEVGDQLMGDDSKPRNVLSTCSGENYRFKVIPRYGEPFVVTENHPLTLKCRNGKLNNGGKTFSSNCTKGEVYDIPASQVAQWKTRLNSFGLMKARTEYPEADLPFDPYAYGLWLGDGDKAKPAITTMDPEVGSFWIGYFTGLGYNHKDTHQKGKARHIHVSKGPGGVNNPFFDFIRSSVDGTKFIRREYLTSSIKQRMSLLAGIIDSDGNVAGRRAYSISCSDPKLMDGYVELCNSLGFQTSRAPKKTNYVKKNGTTATSERLTVMGDVWLIPVKIPRKQIKQPKIKHREDMTPGCCSFKIEEHTYGEYAGFELDGNHRFLLEDYTVTHNTGKSAWEARISLTLLAIDPEYTRVYVAAPFKNVADYTIWSEILTCFGEIKKHHADIFPDAKETPSAKLIQLVPGFAKAGRIDLVGLDNVAKLQGTKSRDANRGFMVLIADEIALFPTQDFLQILDNITGNRNFIGFTGCNFKSIIEMDGILCDPLGMEYTDLRPDEDHMWLSAYNTLTIRLDGHLSPNVLTGRDIYAFLITEHKRHNMEIQHGLMGPKYLEQIRSFPHQSTEDEFILTMDRLQSGGSFDEFYNLSQGGWDRVAFCDPGWGGDPCKIGAFEFGTCKVQTHDGSVIEVQIFRPVGPIETIQVQAGQVASLDFLNRLSAISNGPIMLKEGREITMDLQIAVSSGEFLRRNNIPLANFGFDASCRGSIVQEMGSVLGPEIQVYDLGAMPTEMVVDGVGATAREKYRNLRTECYFALQLIVASGQLRGGHQIMDALRQACRHRVVNAGVKRALESKADYKKVNHGKSPDAADVLVGACHLARKRGFLLSFNRNAQSTSMEQKFSYEDLISIRPRPKFKKLLT